MAPCSLPWLLLAFQTAVSRRRGLFPILGAVCTLFPYDYLCIYDIVAGPADPRVGKQQQNGSDLRTVANEKGRRQTDWRRVRRRLRMAKTSKATSKSGGKKKKAASKEKKLSPEEKEAKAKAKAEAKAAKAAEKEAKKAEKAAAKERKRLEKEEKKRQKEEAKRRKAELKARKKAIKQLRKEQKTARKAHASLQKEREAEEEELQERAAPLGRRLARAAAGGWVPNLRHWLDAGADPNARNERGLAPLHQCWGSWDRRWGVDGGHNVMDPGF